MKKPPRHLPAKPASLPGVKPIHGPGRVRLIGGQWRGTRLAVADSPGLRPTSDRVRETLFNWLAPMLPGARVLDLFAGSGALGLEAVSRGAASAVLVERDPALAAGLREVAAKLTGGDAVTVVQADALAWLGSQADGRFDLAFLDPPFEADLWGAVMPVLATKLAPMAWLYIEAPLSFVPVLDGEWRLHRQGTTRQTHYALYRRTAALSAAATVTLVPDPPDTAPAAKT